MRRHQRINKCLWALTVAAVTAGAPLIGFAQAPLTLPLPVITGHEPEFPDRDFQLVGYRYFGEPDSNQEMQDEAAVEVPWSDEELAEPEPIFAPEEMEPYEIAVQDQAEPIPAPEGPGRDVADCEACPDECCHVPHAERLVVDHLPEEPHHCCTELIEFFPQILSKHDECLGKFFSRILGVEHDSPKTELDHEPIGLQEIPERPRLIVEWNELFLGPGFLADGFELPTGAVWRPAFWVFGQHRSVVQYFDTDRPIDPVSEWANRLDLFGQVNLSGTERILIGLRPFDEERINRREFSSYDFRDGNWIDAENAHFQTLFFEGDFGEIFPNLDPYDTRFLDYGFSVGRMPLLAQQGLLINEDAIRALTVTRNTLYGPGILNMRVTGVYGWDEINRNSPVGMPNTYDPTSKMYALLTETDIYGSTINADVVYVDGDEFTGELLVFGLSSIQRTHLPHNTYNSSLHILASFPQGGVTPFADQGELLFAQISWTPHHTEDLIYFNVFWAIDQFTSPARGTLAGGPVGQTGILFAAPGVGRAGAPIGNGTNDIVGASLGYQLFFDHTRRQIIWELGARKETEGPNLGTIATTLRYQRAIGQHFIFIIDGFVGKRESTRTSVGSRSEILIRF